MYYATDSFPISRFVDAAVQERYTIAKGCGTAGTTIVNVYPLHFAPFSFGDAG